MPVSIAKTAGIAAALASFVTHNAVAQQPAQDTGRPAWYVAFVAAPAEHTNGSDASRREAHSRGNNSDCPRWISTAPSSVMAPRSGPSASVWPSTYFDELMNTNRSAAAGL